MNTAVKLSRLVGAYEKTETARRALVRARDAEKDPGQSRRWARLAADVHGLSAQLYRAVDETAEKLGYYQNEDAPCGYHPTTVPPCPACAQAYRAAQA